MEHSVQAYLERQSTEVLNKLLRELLQAKALDGDTIRLVLRILEKRDLECPEEELLREGYAYAAKE